MKMSESVSGALLIVSAVGLTFGQEAPSSARELSVSSYRSIQKALDANPGRVVYIPAGDYEISERIYVHADNSGLCGPGRIIQTNPDAPIIQIEHASGVQLRALTLTRPQGKMDTKAEAVLALKCRNVVLDNLQVLDNRTRSGAIAIRECDGAQIRGCLIRNYMRVSIDDRTDSRDWGYAFNCIDGSGIVVTYSRGTLIQGNRIIEHNLLPTLAVKQEYNLGKFVKKNCEKGGIINQNVWEEEYVNNWHQGSAIIVTSPTTSDYTQILGNYIENAAQGIDIHADHVIISQNIINDAFMGMKAMHGSRNILVIGNQFSKNDLWSIGMMPGAASHGAAPARSGQEPVEPNVDGGSIIANNIISDFGYGHAHWIWGDDGSPFKFDTGQKPENPALTDVVIQGNIVYSIGGNQDDNDGTSRIPSPRYKYAVSVASDAKGLHFSNNILHPGTEGVSNVELKP
jgi:parallel beta helix pectate lyase-like protein